MKVVKLLGLGIAVFLVWSCGLSPEQACKEVTKASCAKLIECLPENIRKLSPTYKDQASCEAAAKCDSLGTVCKDGKTYSPTKAAACVNEYKALTCGDFTGGGAPEDKIPSCLAVCQ
ncbi:MAG: hypothetical protein EP343_33660 [Deltaproteobacteria bacterium]|nr:MAG: hypothetical protein EP343_33660 [Deltaproteobacteria bacterium]